MILTMAGGVVKWTLIESIVMPAAIETTRVSSPMDRQASDSTFATACGLTAMNSQSDRSARSLMLGATLTGYRVASASERDGVLFHTRSSSRPAPVRALRA